jgi:serine/threonine protein kinase
MISYAHEDKPFVVKLAAALRAVKCDVWYDERVAPGDEYSQLIENKILGAAAVLVVWSGSACNSKWVRAEALKAFDLEKRLIQVVTEPCSIQVPFNALQLTDLSDWNFDAKSPKIAEIISALPIAKPQQVADREPRTSLEETARFLAAEAKINVIDRIAIGEISDVYRGEYGRRGLVIKAFHDSLLPGTLRQNLLAEVAIASNVNHPSFLRISNVLFDKHVCFIVSDHVSGGKTIARRIESEGAASFSVEDVVDILCQLSEAIVEAEVAGLGYLSITPSQIFVKDDRTPLLAQEGQADPESITWKSARKIVRLSPINFSHFKARLEWNKDTGPFMPPEFWLGNRWFKERMEAGLAREFKGEELRRTRLQKSHQFALGMVAWTMLEGRVPFTPDLDDLETDDGISLVDIKEQFVQESKTFSQQVGVAPWRTGARALARIIQRMVQHDPALRWSSMDQVRLLVQALAGNYAANSLDDLVKDAYQAVAFGKEQFYRGFYERLFQMRPHLRAKFPTDMSSQHRMLDYAVGQLFNFNQQQSEPTTLTQFIDRHEKLGLSKEDFESFGTALIESFDAGLTGDRIHERMMAALEIVIWPGIYYMIQRCVAS